MAEGFHFLRPAWLLALLPVIGLLWRAARSREAGGWRRVVDPELLPHLLVPGRAGRKPVLALLAAGWGAAVIALAGPTWERLPQPQLEPDLPPLVVLLDLSRSMAATDIAPSRLVRARHRVSDLLTGAQGRPVAVVAFAGDAFAVTPLVRDPRVAVEPVPALSPDLMPLPGSNLDRALRRAAVLLDRAGAREGDVVLVSDGAGASGGSEAAARLAAAGRRVSVLAVGTEAGAPVPEPGSGTLADADGRPVQVPLDVARLRKVAAAGRGIYVRWQADGGDLEALRAAVAREARRPQQAADRERPAWREEGPWLVLALLPLAALAFRRGWLGVVILAAGLHPPEAAAFEWPALWRNPAQQAWQLLQDGQPLAAAARFRDPMWRGVALYRAGRYDAAAAAFARAGGAEGHYNRGNALARAGRIEAAASAYRHALALAPGHADARYNLQQLQKGGPERPPPTRGGRTLQDEPPPGKEPRPPEAAPESAPPAAGAGRPEGREVPAPDKEKAEAPRMEGTGPPPAGGDDERPAGQERQATGEGAPMPGAPGEGQEGREARSGKTGDAPPEGAGAPSAGGPAMQGEAPPEAGERPPSDRAGPAGDAARPAPGEAARSGGGAGTAAAPPSDQSLEQWLERVPDDPAALLRERFRLEAQRRGVQAEGPPW